MKFRISTIIIFLTLFLTGCDEYKPKTYRIGVSQCSNDEWRTKMNNEMHREAMFHNGLSVEILSANDNSDKQMADINHFIDEGVDLLVVAPNEDKAVTPAVERAFDAGIPVVVIDRNINGNKYTAFIGADNKQIGRMLGLHVANSLKHSGRLIEIKGLEHSTPAEERHIGFLEILKDEPDIKIVASVAGNWLRASAQKASDSLLRIHSGVDMIVAQNDPMALGAYDAAAKVIPHNKVKFVGVDALPGKGGGVEAIENNILDASVIYPTGGDIVIETAMKILEKKPFKRHTTLNTALVDKSNAKIMLLQSKEMALQDNKMEWLKTQVDLYWERHSIQSTLLYACIIIIVLFAALLFFVNRAYWQKKHLNDKLSQQKDTLQQQRDQLLKLTKELEEATHAKLVFFTNVSHDIRTPLTLIMDPVEQVLSSPNINDNERSKLQLAHKNIHILLRLINQILDFRKYENDKLSLNQVNADMGVQILEWADSFKNLALKKHIHLKTVITPEGDYKMALDIEKTERIFFNIVANAMKFTPENGSITISLQPYTIDGDNWVRLSIADTGKGIIPDNIKHIFDPFFQVSDTTQSGSGIGLALVKSFVEIQGGRIYAESQPDVGTTIIVELPVSLVSGNVEKYNSLITSRQVNDELGDSYIIERTEDDNKKNVLIIDDNADIRSYIKNLLSENYNVLEAPDGTRGLKLAMKYVPDVVVCDVMMPFMDGLECCKRLKADIQTSHIPVLLLTACSLDEDRIKAYECGADAYISKPFSARLLTVRIESLIENHSRLKQFFGESTSFAHEKVSDVDKHFAARFRKLIEDNMEDADLSVEELGSKMGLSRVQLYRKIKALTNYSPVELLRIMRLKKAASLLASKDSTVAEIAYQVGFSSPSYFAKCYKDYFGESPTERLKQK